ncbi:hypothetical protein EVAR_96963_1 [Eumeta japonica]|uniref:Uncharacterized protein n=1 Tax=Eumeta variegata TaxID=151549 RepID=A0A4C1VEJ0_EUMVA|nr:hypothetical protein EVAR_96963_1 [Eumeta japonica]
MRLLFHDKTWDQCTDVAVVPVLLAKEHLVNVCQRRDGTDGCSQCSVARIEPCDGGIPFPRSIYNFVADEHRSAGGSWEEPVSAVRNAPLRRSQRLNNTLDSRLNAVQSCGPANVTSSAVWSRRAEQLTSINTNILCGECVLTSCTISRSTRTSGRQRVRRRD